MSKPETSVPIVLTLIPETNPCTSQFEMVTFDELSVTRMPRPGPLSPDWGSNSMPSIVR